MVRSLWTGASGMISGQFNIDVISNNLANINTTGYKRSRAEFEELLYQTQRMAGTPSSELTIYPVPIQVGLGVKPSATFKFHTQGALQNTGNKLDVAIAGEGYFRIVMPDGTYAYTRDGSFKLDSNGELLTSNGYRFDPQIVFPEGFRFESIKILDNGMVYAKVWDSNDEVEVGQIKLYRFTNPAGLDSIGENLFKETPASGPAYEGIPSKDGFGKIHQGFLEMSNVNAVREFVDMIVAQRAYEFNSKAIQTTDNMLGTAVNLKR
ncbi:MAG: flagellar basal-body rod protein FlgG [Brevinematales bacterium]|nr:flagellar basal-body rod protein FlgG [Brevinematales bacterium]